MKPFIAGACSLPLLACAPEAREANNATARPSESGSSVERAAKLAGGLRTEPQKGIGMSTNEILIVTERGVLRAHLAENETARALANMLPLQLRMRDHLRQEKTGMLPSALPDGERQAEFSVGTLGLWDDRDFVIYYGEGRVPAPGIVILGRVSGDLSQLDNPDGVTVLLRRAD